MIDNDHGVRNCKTHLELQSALFRDPEVLEKWKCDSFEGVHRQVDVVVRDSRQGQVERCFAVVVRVRRSATTDERTTK